MVPLFQRVVTLFSKMKTSVHKLRCLKLKQLKLTQFKWGNGSRAKESDTSIMVSYSVEKPDYVDDAKSMLFKLMVRGEVLRETIYASVEVM